MFRWLFGRQASAQDAPSAQSSLDAAIAHHHAGRLAEASAGYERLLATDPAHAEARRLNAHACFNLGNERDAAGRLVEAVACYRRAIDMQPDHAGALCNLGTALKAQGRPGEAAALYQRAVAAQPDLFEAHYNLALAWRELGRIDDAVASFRAALALRPEAGDLHYALGLVLQDADRTGEALACFRRALELDPESLDARYSIVMSQLPWVYTAAENPAACRGRFAAELESLERWFDAGRSARGHRVIGGDLPFALAYQEEDNRALMERYGALCSRLMGQWQAQQGVTAPVRRTRRPLRLGVASAHLRQHSVWMAITRGWFEALDPARVALYAFDLGQAEDAETAFARARAARYEKGPRDLRQWVDAILGCELDALIYPDVGMDSTTSQLAALRLAPLQAATWGHPDTTGLPTIDCYFSAEQFEPAGAQQHYSERLVALPGLGCHFRRQAQEARHPDMAQWGLDPARPLLVCPGVPYKYAPQRDRVLTEIAARLGNAQLLFFRNVKQGLSERLEGRLRQAFERHGLRFDDHARFAPWLDGRTFHGVLQRADVYLDTIGFSGFNTALQAVECGLPVVTLDGRFMRGRLASGILKQMRMQDLVAADERAYVELAVRLVQDADFSEEVAGRMEAARPALYEDAAPIRALEDFLAAAR
jgi:protein O-GlcNAc transferase